MKSRCLPVALMAAAIMPKAPATDPGEVGTLLFSTYLPGVVEVQALREDRHWPNSEFVPADSRFYAQLLAGRPGGPLRTVGEPVPLADAPPELRGTMPDGGVVEVPGIAPGEEVEVQVVAWLRGYGRTWDQAIGMGLGEIGMSGPITVRAGGGSEGPAPLVGLQPFHITTILGIADSRLGPGPTPRVRWSANGHVYQQIEAPFLGWNEARDVAEGTVYEGVPGHLVSVTDESENAFLSAHPGLGNNSDRLLGYWIGAYRMAAQGDVSQGWLWTTGESFDFSAWSVDDPPPLPTSRLAAFLLRAWNGPSGMAWGMTPKFVTDHLNLQINGYIVEFDLDPPPPPPTNPPGPLEVQPLVTSEGAKVLVSWPPEADLVLQRAAIPSAPIWESLAAQRGPGASLEPTTPSPEAVFRLYRPPSE